MAALKIVRRLGIAPWAPSWSDLRPAMLAPEGSASNPQAVSAVATGGHPQTAAGR
jgi:hypothetical protein